MTRNHPYTPIFVEPMMYRHPGFPEEGEPWLYADLGDWEWDELGDDVV
jgi:hypothetical protein